MNVSQYGSGIQQQIFHHQEVPSVQQQFVASNASEGVGVDNVHYCTGANSQTPQFSNTPLDGKSQASQQQNCVPPYTSETSQQNSRIRQSFSMSNPGPLKVDASTMTEKETQTTNDAFFGTGQLQECKSTYPMIPTSATWQSLAGPPGSTVAEYLSRLPASTLPLTLHHFLKFSSAPTNEGPVQQTPISGIKKEDENTLLTKKKKKRKYKKKPYIPRPPRPRPGEIRLTTALDGSTLYCCPECHMAYPERELLEQHLVVHRLERRFVCDICGAGLKRKEHLDRHKQGHNPERPYACSVCLKAFKRNEHLSRHFVIHSGDKTQVCTECGKSFYRKDHLRKHAQSHIAKRLRAEIIGQKSSPSGGSGNQGLGPLNNMTTSPGITAVALMPGAATLPILSS